MRLNKSLKNAITEHAWATYPHECCGLIIDGKYQPCVNTAIDTLNSFEIEPSQLIGASYIVTQTEVLSRPRLTVCRWTYMSWIG